MFVRGYIFNRFAYQNTDLLIFTREQNLLEELEFLTKSCLYSYYVLELFREMWRGKEGEDGKKENVKRVRMGKGENKICLLLFEKHRTNEYALFFVLVGVLLLEF